ncbi:MAG: NDP-hexose 4-ketoreductase [Anaerolineaceae bacterium 4572_78]|nr:MAG: NDP-hexose 4-ketoreductase [Anaerolineaceae bacterium 4572_78]
MADKFDSFTKRARRILTFAQEEAKKLNNNYVGTEHLLLGLVREDSGVAIRVLKDLKVDLKLVRNRLEDKIGKGKRSMYGKLSLTPRTKRVMEYSIDEAKRLGHHYIGTEHLLLGLVREGEGLAVEILSGFGISLEKVRAQTARVMMESPDKVTAGEKKGKKTPLVDLLSTDLTVLAEQGKLDPVVGRQTEIERVIQILSRRNKNNPALIGEPGVGKTAIVEGLAQRIITGNVPETLIAKRVVMLDVGSLVAGTIYRGQFEERLKRIIEEIKKSGSILFIDEVHMLVGAGSAGTSVDAANILKPSLARGELQCIGATTMDEYRKHIEGDAALERRFQPITVLEPTIEETIDILKGVRSRYEAHHNLDITDRAIEAAATLSARYVTDRFMPDKAIDLIDEAGSRVRLYKIPSLKGSPEDIVELRNIRREIEEAVASDRFELASTLRDRERGLQQQLGDVKLEKGFKKPKVTADDIADVVAMVTGIPIRQLATEESERLLHMETVLHQRIVGQDEAVKAISKAVRRSRAGLKNLKRPIGTFMFLGPTGVGKTLLAKSLAEFLFGNEESLIKLDMSEFMERYTVSRLVGSPPGFVGYEEGGQLTEAVRRRPYSVVLFDEIEKAHPDVFNMLLQIMEDGYLADAKGKRINFRNVIVIMTSNVGADLIRHNNLGFSAGQNAYKTEKEAYKDMKGKVMSEMERVFRPEFRNRLDGVMIFRALTKDQIKQIMEYELRDVRTRLNDKNITLRLTDSAREFLVEEGFDPSFGARPLRRALRNHIEDELSEGLLSERYLPNDILEVDYLDKEIVVIAINRKTEFDVAIADIAEGMLV